MTLARPGAAGHQMTWEPFHPEKLGYERLSEWLAEFYSGDPYDEFMKCFACSSSEDFTFVGAYSEEQLAGRLDCPECGAALHPFWSPERAQAFFRALAGKGTLTGFIVRLQGEPVGCMWGYEVEETTPVAWEPRPAGKGAYVDRTLVVPEQRNGIVLWYLLLVALREFRRENSYLVTRAHLRATMIRTMLQRLGFQELNECPILPERSYWVRSLAVADNLPPLSR